MQHRLKHTLGQFDAKKCNEQFGASLSLDAKDLRRGCIIDLPQAAFDWLTGPRSKKCRGYFALMEPAGKVRGDAKETELKSPAK
jgi:hypothetical protein